MPSTTSVLVTVAVGVLAYYYKFGQDAKALSPVVDTTYGKLQGVTGLSRDGKVFYEYFGIPYAKPPLGELRYESPQKPEKWSGVRDATKFRDECAQLDMFSGGKLKGSEDCLFLNVFTAELNPKDGKLKPTLFFIHGGGFVFGSANMYKADYIVDADVVLVTLNYRLAALGFLNTEDGLIRGNMGLKDQTLALKWVKENIARFGGDPTKVTLVGESAGAASVHYQLLSPSSKGLMSAAISQSGSAVSAWSIKLEPLNQAKRYASNVNCATTTTKAMVQCLKGKTTEELLKGHAESLATLKDPITWFGPSIEVLDDGHAFIVEHPAELIKKGKAHRVPWITGYNSHEGLLSSATIVRDQSVLKQFQDDFANVMHSFLLMDSSMDKSKLKLAMEKVRDFYFGPGERIDTIHKMENYTNVVTDNMWMLPLHETATAQSEFSPVYAYYYSYKGDFTLTRILLALKGDYPIAVEFLIHKIKEWFERTLSGEEYIHHGACHGDELALLFKLEGMYEINQSHEDYKASKELVKLWTDFAKDEKPLKYKIQVWKPLEKEAKAVKYLLIDSTTGMIDQPNPEQLQFWKGLLKTHFSK